MGKEDQIIAGLFEAMKVDDFSLITVTQIAQEAEIGRKTFYRYFKNKEEVLERSVELLFLEYAAFEKNYFASDYETLIYYHFAFWRKYSKQLNILYKNDLMFYVFRQYQKHVPQLNAAYIRQENSVQTSQNTPMPSRLVSSGRSSILGSKPAPEKHPPNWLRFVQTF